MPRLSLSPKFIKETIHIFRSKSLKEIFFGKKVQYSRPEKKLAEWISKNAKDFKKIGGRKGDLVTQGLVHKGTGTVYLLPNKLKDSKKQSLLLFDDTVKIQSGPDLWVYLSTSKNPTKSLGSFIDLGLLKGTQGGQSYVVKKPVKQLAKYSSVIIYCKQFEVIFTFAILK